MLTCTFLGLIGYILFPKRYEKMHMAKANKLGYVKMLIPLGFFSATYPKFQFRWKLAHIHLINV
jgi:multisubunit Na+/H+ antiporter MnhG subunit